MCFYALRNRNFTGFDRYYFYKGILTYFNKMWIYRDLKMDAMCFNCDFNAYEREDDFRNIDCSEGICYCGNY